ncbi:MAG: 50S ribosomal protein L4 [Pirellulaceae bacterium]|nr:MAG: 50S ribosomal protein L4 [Pirellulaceae bacterium]
MVTLTVYDRAGAEVGKVDVDPAAIAPRINRQLLHDAVVMYLANRRQGTKKTKGRGEVAGSTRKLYRQKGTGNARAGSRRAPQRRGGGHAMQLRPRSFYYRLPKKAVQLATRMAVASKLRDGEVLVLDRLEMEVPKTKELAATLKALGLAGSTVLLATESLAPQVYRSARNIPGVEVLPVSDLNALSLLRPKRVVFTQGALEKLAGTAVATA